MWKILQWIKVDLQTLWKRFFASFSWRPSSKSESKNIINKQPQFGIPNLVISINALLKKVGKDGTNCHRLYLVVDQTFTWDRDRNDKSHFEIETHQFGPWELLSNTTSVIRADNTIYDNGCSQNQREVFHPIYHGKFYTRLWVKLKVCTAVLEWNGTLTFEVEHRAFQFFLKFDSQKTILNVKLRTSN